MSESRQAVRQVYWSGEVDRTDDFGDPIADVFYDARTVHGPWAIMTPKSAIVHGYTRSFRPILGQGHGQRYERQADGRWLKTEG